jgi:hypothetical protein
MIHREKLGGARRQLLRVADAERAYLDGNPYRLIHRYDPRAAQYTVRVEVERPVPAEISALAASTLRDAIAALDALAATLASPEGSAGSAPHFPIHESLPQFAQRSRRSLAAMRDEAQAEIEALQPYHRLGGFQHDPLWLLRELAAESALRLAPGALRGETALGINTKRHVDVIGELRASAGPFEHGAIIASVAARVAGPDPKLDLYLKPTFEVALARGGPARGASLLGMLGAICDHVEREVFARLEPWVTTVRD